MHSGIQSICRLNTQKLIYGCHTILNLRLFQEALITTFREAGKEAFKKLVTIPQLIF